MRRSRDDFIKADEIMRSQADDDNEVGSSLLQLRDYLLDRGLFPTEQEFLSPSFNADTHAWGARFRRFSRQRKDSSTSTARMNDKVFLSVKNHPPAPLSPCIM